MWRSSVCLVLSVAALHAGTDIPHNCAALLSVSSQTQSLNFTPPITPTTLPKCSVAKGIGGARSRHCYWTFDFRASGASDLFAELKRTLEQCSDPGGPQLDGARVNHPDSFTQITGNIAGRTVAISLKDKGALGQTLVFLAYEIQ